MEKRADKLFASMPRKSVSFTFLSQLPIIMLLERLLAIAFLSFAPKLRLKLIKNPSSLILQPC